MAVRYTALPNPTSDRNEQHGLEGASEMEAAFDYSEDDDDDEQDTSESHPLNPAPLTQSSQTPRTYDFENLDYDFPPPGSPPRPSQVALPNDHGNSNGFVPSFSLDSAPAPQHNWFRRTVAAILPPSYAQRLGLAHQRPVGAVGGGTLNDGVFANVTAKPSRPVTVQDGDETYIVPEDSRPEAPPSYASAQADAVPPYWETTVHAPFAPGAIGEMIVDSLPTGSLFSFLWNMLVSISFQFIGFLLTYLLHTTHAARLGSRAGLGVTLIQYGFALRARLDDPSGNNAEPAGWKSGWSSAPSSSPDSAYPNNPHGAPVNGTVFEEQANMLVADATTEWLSFFLMTVGWFILLTSLLGFWRVKRWERGILASQQDHSNPTINPQPSSHGAFFSRIFSLHGTSQIDMFRQGFGFGSRRNHSSGDPQTALLARAEEGNLQGDQEEALETDLMIPADADPQRNRLIAEALANDRRLQADLRSAGLL